MIDRMDTSTTDAKIIVAIAATKVAVMSLFKRAVISLISMTFTCVNRRHVFLLYFPFGYAKYSKS